MSKEAIAYLEQFRDAPWVAGMTPDILEQVAKNYWRSYWDNMEADTKRLADSK